MELLLFLSLIITVLSGDVCLVYSGLHNCYKNRTCVACVTYADDLLLLSASICGLQRLRDICALTSKELCLQFNDRKSQCIVFGPRHRSELTPMLLLGKPLQWVDSLKYLGMTFMSSKTCAVDLDPVKRKFFWMCELYIK